MNTTERLLLYWCVCIHVVLCVYSCSIVVCVLMSYWCVCTPVVLVCIQCTPVVLLCMYSCFIDVYVCTHVVSVGVYVLLLLCVYSCCTVVYVLMLYCSVCTRIVLISNFLSSLPYICICFGNIASLL